MRSLLLMVRPSYVTRWVSARPVPVYYATVLCDSEFRDLLGVWMLVRIENEIKAKENKETNAREPTQPRAVSQAEGAHESSGHQDAYRRMLTDSSVLELCSFSILKKGRNWWRVLRVSCYFPFPPKLPKGLANGWWWWYVTKLFNACAWWCCWKVLDGTVVSISASVSDVRVGKEEMLTLETGERPRLTRWNWN